MNIKEQIIALEDKILEGNDAVTEALEEYNSHYDTRDRDYWGTLYINARQLQIDLEDLVNQLYKRFG